MSFSSNAQVSNTSNISTAELWVECTNKTLETLNIIYFFKKICSVQHVQKFILSVLIPLSSVPDQIFCCLLDVFHNHQSGAYNLIEFIPGIIRKISDGTRWGIRGIEQNEQFRDISWPKHIWTRRGMQSNPEWYGATTPRRKPKQPRMPTPFRSLQPRMPTLFRPYSLTP